MFEYSATVTRVVDGDTVDLLVDCGFHIKTTIRTRLLGVNTPEVSTKEGRDVRDAVRVLLPVGTEVTVKTFKDPGDKFGRWLAKIETVEGDLGDWLLARKWAVPFMVAV